MSQIWVTWEHGFGLPPMKSKSVHFPNTVGGPQGGTSTKHEDAAMAAMLSDDLIF